MEHQPNTFRFSLRALFVCTTFVGVGLLAIKYPSPISDLVVTVATLLLLASAIAIALLTTGSRRGFWATFAVFSFVLLQHPEVVPPGLSHQLWKVVHRDMDVPITPRSSLPLPPPSFSSDDLGESVSRSIAFRDILFHCSVLVFSTAAAYIVPWLVQRGQKPPVA